MLGGATLALTSLRAQSAPADRPGADPVSRGPFTVIDGGRSRSSKPSSSSRTSGGFMNRLEERWRRRRDNGPF